MIEFIAEHINTISTLISAWAALLTAVATFFLWRVTRLLADETKRMVDASVQPHVVVTLEPNSWAAFYFDINIANTGNAPAYDIEIGFNPPLVNAEHRKNKGIPFSKVSVLKNGHSLNSSLCKYEQIKDQVYSVSISWSKQPGSTERERAAKGDVNRPDRHLFNRHSDGTGNEERPLRGTNPNRPDGGCCLRGLRI